MPQTAAIEFSGVSFAYGEGEGARPALQGINLRVAEGAFVAVIGSNGSGKSTLARHINALLTPSAGTVRTCGLDTADAANHFSVRSQVGFVFQNPENQTVASLVEDDVAFGPENLGLPSAEIRTRVDDALEAVGLAGYQRREAHSLSGGQKQRVALAGALAMQPRVLVMDEPGAMLDVRGRRQVVDIAHRLNAQGVTVVLVTHFMEEAAGADYVVALDGGRIALEGTPQEVLTQVDALRSLQLEPPFTVRVGAALRNRGLDAPLTLDAGELAAWLAARGFGAASASQAETAPQDSSDAIVVIEGASFAYGAQPVLHDVSLTIAPGDFVGILGHTGSGKSTLAQLMNALLTPVEGTVRVGGSLTTQRTALKDIRSTVGYVFQYPEHQLFATTVAEEVAFGPHNLKLSDAEIGERVREALELVGFEYDAIAQASPFALSGGQQRRVALADVLAMRPQVLVLDEPTAGLDPASCAQVRRFLQDLNARGIAIVLITHNMDDAAALCRRCVVLDEGRVAFLGAPAEIFTAENASKLNELGLDLPQAASLALEAAPDAPVLPLTLEALVAAV